MDATEQALKDLRWIKWLTGLLALSFAVIAAAFVWISVEASATFAVARDSDVFTDRASRLLDKGKAEEVLALAEGRAKQYPMDPNVHWYRGKAYYQQARYPEALEAIRKVHDMAPTWREEHTGPYIKAIEEKLAAKR